MFTRYKHTLLLFTVLLAPLNGFSQFNVVEFKFRSAETGKELTDVQLQHNFTEKLHFSDKSGTLRLALPTDTVRFVVSSSGFKPQMFKLYIYSDSLITRILQPLSKSVMVNEVQIIASAIHQSRNETTIKQIDAKIQPSLGGSVDITKIIVKQAGVQELNEGSGDIIIRGGLPKHANYVVSNRIKSTTSAGLGLISPFNAHVISESVVNKSYISPKYTDFLSGVVLLQPLKPKLNKPDFKLNLNPFVTGAYMSVPIVKGASAVSVSARHTLFPYMKGVFFNNEVEHIRYTDLSIASYSELTNGFSLSLNFDYLSDGNINKFNATELEPYNQTWATLNKDLDGEVLLIRQKKDSKFSAFAATSYHAYSNEYLKEEETRTITDKTSYGKSTNTFGFSVEKRLGSFSLNYGTDVRIIGISPYVVAPPGVTQNDTVSYAANQTIAYPYFELNSTRKSKFTYRMGMGIQNTFNNNTYSFLPEPRLLLSYSLKPSIQFDVAYIKSHKHIQTLSSTSLGFPKQLPILPSQTAPAATDQLSLSINKIALLGTKRLELKISSYVKQTRNALWFRKGENLNYLLNYAMGEPEKRLQNYTAESFGIETEILLKAKSYQLSANYTFSNSFLKNTDTKLRKRSPFDIPHSLNIAAHKQINKKWSIAVNWAYHTGLPLDLPLHKYTLRVYDFGLDNFKYEQRGGYIGQMTHMSDETIRFSPYHRLDISVDYTFLRSTKRKHAINVSIINIYNRHNAYYVNQDRVGVDETLYDIYPEDLSLRKYKLDHSYLYPILPTIGYVFEF